MEELWQEFQRLFPSIDNRPRNLKTLIEKYCYKDITRCPLCGGTMKQRRGKHGPFNGCTGFPYCKGTRQMDGSIALTAAVREYVLWKDQEAAINGTPDQSNRFELIDMDET